MPPWGLARSNAQWVISAHGMRMGCLAAAPMCLHKERASERGVNTLLFLHIPDQVKGMGCSFHLLFLTFYAAKDTL